MKASVEKRESLALAELQALSDMPSLILPRERRTTRGKGHLQGSSMVQEGCGSWGATRGRAARPEAARTW